VCGWQAALVQLAGIVASFFIYMPFAKSLDDEYLALESEQA
jgi:cellobiose-specific phosphotransferase system component IIC